MSKTLLHKAVDAIVTLKHPGHMLEGNELFDWLGSVNLRHATISISTGDATGLGPEGVVAVSTLAKTLRVPSTAYRRGASHATFAEGVAKQFIVSFGKSPRPTVDDAAVVQFEADVAAWFAREAVVRRHYVPCAILPGRAGAFAVGPVTFIHADRMIGHPIILPRIMPLLRLLGTICAARSTNVPRAGSPWSISTVVTPFAPARLQIWRWTWRSQPCSSSFRRPTRSRWRG